VHGRATARTDKPPREALDVFMVDVKNETVQEDAKKLELQLRLTREQLKQVNDLIDIADPSGEHRKRLESMGTQAGA
jgi:hypothetical protein